MLKKIYCLFEAEPEEISGFADFARQLKENNVQLYMLTPAAFGEVPEEHVTAKLLMELRRFAEAKDSILVTDTELEGRTFALNSQAFEISKVNTEPGYYKISLPVAGFLDEHNGGSLSYKYLFESFEDITLDYFNMIYCRFHGLPLEILETERLRVREMTLADIDRLYEIYSEPSITEYMEGLYPDKQDELEFARSYIENMYGFYGYGLWLVLEKASGRIVGRAGLGNREIDGEIHLELGYVIAKEYQGRGYATEVSLAILDYARTELAATKVISLIKPGNEPSVRTARKLGFTQVGEVTLNESLEKYLYFIKAL